MSLKNRFESWTRQDARGSLTKFFCFDIHTLIPQQLQGFRNN